MLKSTDALLKKPEVIGQQVHSHDPRGKHKNGQGNLESSCNIRYVMTIKGMVGHNCLQVISSFRPVNRIDYIYGQGLIEGEADREG